jgi:hypothetical protein
VPIRPQKTKAGKTRSGITTKSPNCNRKFLPLDRSIAELQAVLEGKTVNAPPHYGGNRIGDWKDQLQQLEKKRQDALDKISSLEDEARHNGVSPNALP